MLEIEELKGIIHKKISTRDKLLCVLVSFGAAASIADLRRIAAKAGWRMAGINPSATLGRSGGLAIRTDAGWEITAAGKAAVAALGVADASSHLVAPAIELRKQIASIGDEPTRAFLLEAVACFEHRLYRAAVVMAWTGAVRLLQGHVHANHLAEVNAAAADLKGWSPARSIDDLSKMKESDFLSILQKIGVLQKNTKEELDVCLRRRNAAGHPNSHRMEVHSAAHHLEVLMLNVFSKY